MLHIFEGFGQQLEALGVPERAQFDCASALVNYIVGLAGQYAAGARLVLRGTDRTAFLAGFAAQWAQLDPAGVPVRPSGGGATARARRPRAIPGRRQPHPGGHRSGPIGAPCASFSR
jgi:hypothetical protein